MDCSCKCKRAELLGKVRSGTEVERLPLPTDLSCWFVNKTHQSDEDQVRDFGGFLLHLQCLGWRSGLSV